MSNNQPYWAVDLPGLSKEGAAEVAEWAQSKGLTEISIVVDPGLFLALNLDRETVSAIHAALVQYTAPPESDSGIIAGSVAGVLEEWLEVAAQ